MPGLEVQERRDEVEAVGRAERDDDVAERRVVEQGRDVLPAGGRVGHAEEGATRWVSHARSRVARPARGRTRCRPSSRRSRAA